MDIESHKLVGAVLTSSEPLADTRVFGWKEERGRNILDPFRHFERTLFHASNVCSCEIENAELVQNIKELISDCRDQRSSHKKQSISHELAIETLMERSEAVSFLLIRAFRILAEFSYTSMCQEGEESTIKLLTSLDWQEKFAKLKLAIADKKSAVVDNKRVANT